MTQTFAPMSPPAKQAFRTQYLAYLRDRDGIPDLAHQRFDVREQFFAQVDAMPVLWTGALPIDPTVFERNAARSSPEPGLDEATLWALATAKTNRAERFGVEHELATHGVPPGAESDPHVYVQVEEFYHTRILVDALATLGLRLPMADPGPITKVLIRAMVQLPAALSDVLVFCGEIVGVALFSLLLERARTLFASQPRVMARIEQLFSQILVDEVGHVHFVRSRLSPLQLAVARPLLPLVALGALFDNPDFVRLFGLRAVLARAVAGDVDGAAAPYPDRFVFIEV